MAHWLRDGWSPTICNPGSGGFKASSGLCGRCMHVAHRHTRRHYPYRINVLSGTLNSVSLIPSSPGIVFSIENMNPDWTPRSLKDKGNSEGWVSGGE